MQPASLHFLVVDQNKEIRSLLRSVIGRCCARARIFEAENGHEAMKLYESHGADLMIVDHHIPLLDGLSLVRFLRAQGVTVPVVLTSQNTDVEKLSVSAGATRFVLKPQLIESLDQLLPGWLDGAAKNGS